MTANELRVAIGNSFPPNATCWSEATDEMRDMVREARQVLGLDSSHAVAFNSLRTPQQWNTVGTDSIIIFYSWMNQQQKEYFLAVIADWIG